MNISERTVRIIVADVVTGFRHHFFNPADCPNITLAYQEARSRLDGISLIFPDGRISRFIQNYQNELFQLALLAGCTIPLVGSDSLPMDEYYQDQIEIYGLVQGGNQ